MLCRPWLIAACALLPCVDSAPAWADDSSDDALGEAVEREDYSGRVIQERTLLLEHEIAVSAGVMPVDPFYKGYTVSLSYTWHLDELWAVAPVNLTWSFNDGTKLRRELERVAVAEGNRKPQFEELELIFAPHLIVKPLYGKQTLFNAAVVHVEAWLQAGPALTRYASPDSGMGYGLDLGAGLRFWLNDFISWRIEIGELVFWDGGGPEQALHIHTGLAWNIRGGL